MRELIQKHSFSLLFAATMGCAVGCGKSDAPHDGTHNIWFMGAVIDGQTGQPIGTSGSPAPTYSISLVYGQTTVTGKVDPTTGRYTLGPLPAWNDYGVLIDGGAGYRAFSSYNAGIAPPAPPSSSLSADIYTADTTQTFDFDAYVFPSALTAPAVTLSIVETGPNAMPAMGNIRLQPTSQSVIQGQAAEVTGQVWSNDQDLFAATINDVFSAGSYAVADGTLVYGVNYQATIYGVDGYQPGSGTFEAGVTSTATISLSPETTTPLMLVSSTASSCTTGDALTTSTGPVAPVTFTFNLPIEDGTTTAGGGAEALDNGLYVVTEDGAALKTSTSTTMQERGTSFVISGNMLTIGWDPAAGLASQIANDFVYELIYGETVTFQSIYLQPVGHPEARQSLYTLTAALDLICQG